ncbi:MAG: hypothetical protein ACREMA_19420, partial [Longimicrobiales bacterium]
GSQATVWNDALRSTLPTVACRACPDARVRADTECLFMLSTTPLPKFPKVAPASHGQGDEARFYGEVRLFATAKLRQWRKKVSAIRKSANFVILITKFKNGVNQLPPACHNNITHELAGRAFQPEAAAPLGLPGTI